LALALGAALLLPATHGQAQQGANKVQDTRYVVFHRPGPAWRPGKTMFEQPGVRAHVAHYRQWLEAGQLELGGPHLDATGGGMMIPVAGLAQDEVRRFANEDPAVKDGTLTVEVRPWLIGMSR
jgi:uncharacterized protein YciI